MKKLILIFAMMLVAVPQMMAQQQKEDKRSKTIFVYPEFKDAKVLQPFGRFVKAKANILYKNAALCFIQDGKVLQAYTKNLLGVEFDSVKYMKVDSMMGCVVASKDYNFLVCVTTIDRKRYEDETWGGDRLPYFQIQDLGLFLELDSDKHGDAKGYPLKDKYYFIVKGTVVPAVESKFKKVVRPDMKQAFKSLMADRWWSWTDEASLRQLLEYLPK